MTFINPYNFASLGEKRSNAPVPEGKLLSGYLKCQLTTLSPLFIPNTTNNRVFTSNIPGHSSYEFFSYDDLSGKEPCSNGYRPEHPVIPGSSLRGALRSVYEALTNSCLSTLTDFPLHSRVPNARKAGLLFCRIVNEQEVWSLQPARRYLIQTSPCQKAVGPMWSKTYHDSNEWQISLDNRHHYKTGDTIRFRIGADYIKHPNIVCGKQAIDFGSTASDSHQGVLFIGEPFNKRKHFDHIFKAESVDPIALSEDDIGRLRLILKYYADNKINKDRQHKRYAGYSLSLAQKSTGLPVFYFEIGHGTGTHYHLAPAMMSRCVYFNTLVQLAEHGGNYQPCSDPDNLCPACALFGMVGERGSLGSRVRITDANLMDGQSGFFDPKLTLSELLAPHVTSMEFYTDARCGTFRTYDFEAKYINNNQFAPVPYSPNSLPRLRGRKMYWHGFNRSQGIGGQLQNVEPNKFNSTIRPIKSGVKFVFRLYYDQVTETELKRLISLLVLTPVRAHKIGRGKPLGMGSVQIQVNKALNRELEYRNGIVTYKMIPFDLTAWYQGEAPHGDDIRQNNQIQTRALQEAYASFQKENVPGFEDTLSMLYYNQVHPRIVQYPGYNFFRYNRGIVNNPKYIHVLPQARDRDQLSLPLTPGHANNKANGHPRGEHQNHQYGNRSPGRR